MCKITKIIIHCSDSDNPKHNDISVIKQWHLERGFKDVGYHTFIKSGGEIQIGRDINQIGAHCRGHNKHSIGICLSGKHNFTDQQFAALRALIEGIRNLVGNVPIYPHNAFNNAKTCPNFNIYKATGLSNA